MTAHPRAVILAEIDQWRAEGWLDEEDYRLLRARYEGAPDAAELPAVASDAAGAGAYATHLLGGLLLGAALVACIQFFVPIGPWQPYAALALGVACIVAARAAERRRGEAVAEAGFAAGLVASASVPFYALAPPTLAALAAVLAVGATLMRRGRTPLALLCAAAYFVTARHATQAGLLSPGDAGAAWLFLGALAAYAALLARQRASAWGARALALQALAILVATFPVLDALGVTDPGVAALALGVSAGALFAVGVRLDARLLVAVSSAVVASAALAFAFLALGPALAAMVLLLMGAALVWQAEAVRGYFGARRATEGRASEA